MDVRKRRRLDDSFRGSFSGNYCDIFRMLTGMLSTGPHAPTRTACFCVRLHLLRSYYKLTWGREHRHPTASTFTQSRNRRKMYHCARRLSSSFSLWALHWAAYNTVYNVVLKINPGVSRFSLSMNGTGVRLVVTCTRLRRSILSRSTLLSVQEITLRVFPFAILEDAQRCCTDTRQVPPLLPGNEAMPRPPSIQNDLTNTWNALRCRDNDVRGDTRGCCQKAGHNNRHHHRAVRLSECCSVWGHSGISTGLLLS